MEDAISSHKSHCYILRAEFFPVVEHRFQGAVVSSMRWAIEHSRDDPGHATETSLLMKLSFRRRDRVTNDSFASKYDKIASLVAEPY